MRMMLKTHTVAAVFGGLGLVGVVRSTAIPTQAYRQPCDIDVASGRKCIGTVDAAKDLADFLVQLNKDQSNWRTEGSKTPRKERDTPSEARLKLSVRTIKDAGDVDLQGNPGKEVVMARITIWGKPEPSLADKYFKYVSLIDKNDINAENFYIVAKGLPAAQSGAPNGTGDGKLIGSWRMIRVTAGENGNLVATEVTSGKYYHCNVPHPPTDTPKGIYFNTCRKAHQMLQAQRDTGFVRAFGSVDELLKKLKFEDLANVSADSLYPKLLAIIKERTPRYDALDDSKKAQLAAMAKFWAQELPNITDSPVWMTCAPGCCTAEDPI